MRIALIGPGYGHNIIPYLEYFNQEQKYKLDFYFHHKDWFSKQYTRIKFIAISKGLVKLFFKAKKYDVIWLLGGGRLLHIISFIKFFMREDAKLVIVPYGEKLPRRTGEKSLRGVITRNALSRFSIIHCGWYGIFDLLSPNLKKKAILQAFGLRKEYFKISKDPDKDILKLIEKVNVHEYNFYYPKSFLNVSRHDLVIEAVRLLKEDDSIPKFKVYFLGGNEQDNLRYQELVSLISKYNLENDVIILPKTKFFRTEDLNLLWGKMDCGLQIAQWDGLSTTIFEPLVNEKELIISDIPPYKYLEKYFGFKFELTPLTVKDIAKEMKKKILKIDVKSGVEKQQIKEIIKEKYSFEKDMQKLLLIFEKGN